MNLILNAFGILKTKEKFLMPSIVFFLIFQISGCSVVEDKASFNVAAQTNVETQTNKAKEGDPELEKNRRLWREKNITDYDFVCSFTGRGLDANARPVLIKVRDGQSISFEAIGKKGLSLDRYKLFFSTIDKIFDDIVFEAGQERTRVEVEYDEEFGFPRKIQMVGSGADNAYDFEIHKLEIINQTH